MTPGYTKLFSSIIFSSIWREKNEVRIVWITMLALRDRDNEVHASVPGLADAARVPVEECRAALAVLEAPDPDSRSTEFDGRRIEKIDGGWRILNGDKYRKLMGIDERREYVRKKVAECRERKRLRDAQKLADAQDDARTSRESEVQAPVEVENPEIKGEQKDSSVSEPCNLQYITSKQRKHSKSKSKRQSKSQSNSPKTETNRTNQRETSAVDAELSGFAEFWNAYPDVRRKHSRAKCEKAWRARSLSKESEKIVAGVQWWAKSPEWTKDDGEFVCTPIVFLNQRRWDSIPASATKVQELLTKAKVVFT